MAKTTLYTSLRERDKDAAIKTLIKKSTPDDDFFLMIILSILMATLGLLLNSVTIIIGSMLIAPTLYPILSLALGLNLSDKKLISWSLYTMLKSAGLSISFALFVTLLFSGFKYDFGTEIISRTEPSLAYLVIAIIAGFAASYTMVKPDSNETIPGIAISVALVPPLAVIGIGLARLDWAVASNATLLFLLNIVGVIFAALINFSLINFYLKKHIAKETFIQEDRKVKKEKAKAKKEEDDSNDEEEKEKTAKK